MSEARFMPRWQVAEVTGAVVAIDVIRAFTTAAYAFAAGARHIYLVDSVAEALALKHAEPEVVVMGEDRGRRPDGSTFRTRRLPSPPPISTVGCWCSEPRPAPEASSRRARPPACGAPAWSAHRQLLPPSVRAASVRRHT